MRAFVYALLGVFLLAIIVVPARAQDVSPASAELLQRILDDAMAQPDDVQRQRAFIAHLPELQAASATDPMLKLAVAYLGARFATDAATAWLLKGVDEIPQGQVSVAMFSGAELDFVEAAASSSLGIPPTQLELYKLGTSWNDVLSLGLTMKDFGGRETPQVASLIDAAGKVFKAEKSAEQYFKDNDPDVATIMGDILDLVPSAASPVLSGPLGVALSDLMNWNASFFDRIDDGIDILNDGMRTGHLDHERLARLTQQIKTLARQGPWGTQTAKAFLNKWLANFPRLSKLLGALWPDLPLQCHLISCDCGNVSAGLLTKQWQEQCKESEDRISKMCLATGKLTGVCNPGGPAAFPFE